MKRKRLSPKVKASILERQGGVCAICLAPALRYEYDHEIALAIGGADDPDQINATCVPCHKAKTRDDIRIIAKIKRIRRTQSGERSRARKGPPLKSKPFRIWRAMDGTIRTKGNEP